MLWQVCDKAAKRFVFLPLAKWYIYKITSDANDK